MDLSPELFDEISAYIHHRMSAEERLQFRQRISEDEELRQEVVLQQRLQQGLETVLIEQGYPEPDNRPIRQQFARVRLEQQQQRWQQQRTYAIAASVALLLVFSVTMLITTPSKPATEVAFAAYYQPEPRTRGDAPFPAALAKAQNEYYARHYEEALIQLKKIPDDSLFQISYYRGLAQLALNRTNDASSNFRVATQSPDSRIKRRAEWYLSLTLLRANDTEQATRILRQIADNPVQPYREQAIQILRDIQ